MSDEILTSEDGTTYVLHEDGTYEAQEDTSCYLIDSVIDAGADIIGGFVDCFFPK